ncbi:MAG: winged helix-turn-helix domain-containing protein [Pyrinomonadaceae bacterium]|nr:winged helix-turn-helix domain-containing protein [Pyrinomonadaceae bacterium]
MDSQHVSYYEFGSYRLFPHERLLLREGQTVSLRPKVFETLLVLVQHRGRLLSKDALMNLVWRGSIVEEGNLTQNIFLLRKIFGESPFDHQYIVTIPGEGYRFVADVREVLNETSDVNVAAAQAHHPVGAQDKLRSIAVLPLKTLNGEGVDEHLGAGIADALITKLSYVKGIVVRPTTAVLKYKDASQNPLAAGRELRVDAVLDGTVQRADDRIRVNVQLLKIGDDTILWADKFDETFTNIFAVQDSISEQVAQVLSQRLSREELTQLRKSPTENVEAYQLYIKGRYFWEKRTEQGIKKGIQFAEQIIGIDPTFVSAYVGLADSYSFLGEYLHLDPNKAFPKAKEAALKALEIDATLAEPHAALAETLLFHDWDWDGAEREYRQAIELNPNYASAQHFYTWLLMMQGRFDEAQFRIEQAQKIDPGSLTLNTAVGLPAYFSRDYDRAIKQFRQTLDLDPDYIHAHYYLGAALTHKGMYREAIAEFEAHRRLWVDDYVQQARALLGYTYAVQDNRSAALNVLNELREQQNRRYISPYCTAIVYAGLGESEQALAELERALRERAAWMVFIKSDPWFDTLRSDPRFADLVRHIGLAP